KFQTCCLPSRDYIMHTAHLNQQPFGYYEDDHYRLYRGSVPYVALKSEGVHAFSEFKVWNITKLEAP
ncbi:MAG TPA: hypothetical protein PLF42_12505, partial [Anaerolineales bacterium]|nr:hypothetical protein [Anaerolineales bacterium]